MSALELIRHRVHPSVVNRGVRYYLDGRVHDFYFDGELARARVAGSTDYDTRVRFDERAHDDVVLVRGVPLGRGLLQARGRGARRGRSTGAARGDRRGARSWRSRRSASSGDVRYRVRIDRQAHEPITVEALTPRAKGGERVVPLREVVSMRPSDRALVDLVASPAAWWGERQGTRVEGARAPFVLPMLAQTGRATITVDGDEETPLEHDPGAPYTFGVTCEVDGRGLAVKGELVRGDEHVDLGTPRVLLANGLVLIGPRLSRVSIPSFAWVRTLREKTMRVAENDVEDFAEFAATAPFSIIVARASSLRAGRRFARARGARFFDWARRERDGRVRLRRKTRGRARAARRSLDEAHVDSRRRGREDWLDAMRAAGFRVNELEIAIGSAKLPRAVRQLMQLGARVEGERGALFRTATRFSSRVSSRHRLARSRGRGALRRGDRRASRRSSRPRAAASRSSSSATERSRCCPRSGSRAVLALRRARRRGGRGDSLSSRADGDRRRAPRRAPRGRRRRRRAEAPRRRAIEARARASPRKAFSGELREYQRDGLGWIRWLEQAGLGGCLADDMGLGKTVQVLAHLAGRRTKKPSLVVAPRSLVFNWKDEAARFAPRLRVLEHVGTDRRVDGIRDADLVLTTYGTLRRDIEALAKIEFDYAILDEAQAIKNRASVSAKAARLLRADHRLALTGTPVENHVSELGSLFSFVEPGLLDGPALDRLDKRDGAQVRDTLARILRPFVLRRTKSQVARELPDRIEQTRFVDLDQAERARYTQLRDHYRKRILQTRGGAKPDERARGAPAIAPGGVSPGAHRRERARRDEREARRAARRSREVTEAGTRRSSSRSSRASSPSCANASTRPGVAYEYLDGQDARSRRARRALPDPRMGRSVFLISLKAGGLGLNLTAAEYVFLLDPWWNPAVEAQAIDRTHRIGQTRTVMAYRLIARDTVEEHVLTLQESKRALFESLFGDGGAIGSLTPADLDLLLS